MRVIYPMLTEPLPVPAAPSLPPLTWFESTEQPLRTPIRLDYLQSASVGPILPVATPVPPLTWLSPTEQPLRLTPRIDYLLSASSTTPRPLHYHGWLQPTQQPQRAAPRMAYLVTGGVLPPIQPGAALLPYWHRATQLPLWTTPSRAYLAASMSCEPVSFLAPVIIPVAQNPGIAALALPTFGVLAVGDQTSGIVTLGDQTTGILEVL